MDTSIDLFWIYVQINLAGFVIVGLFLSTTINKLDKKGRVSVPSTFRSALAGEDFQGVVLFQSYIHQAIEGVGMSAMTDYANRIDTNFDTFSDTHDDMATILFGESIQLGFDKDGRITLPQNFIDFMGIEDTIAFVGMGQKFQLWKPETFEARRNQARKSLQSQKMTLPKGDNA